MTGIQAGLAGVTAAGTALTLVAEARGRPRLRVVAKLLASSGFVALGALSLDAGGSFGALLLIGLGLCLVGDLCLALPGSFRVGLVAFLLGHLAYLAGFAARSSPAGWPLAPLAVVATAAGLVLRWLWPRLGDMRLPVTFYVLAIAAMVWGAFGVVSAGAGPARLAVGATAFFLSDLAVARNRFVAPGLINRLWGLPLYYLGQLLIASSGP